MSRNWRDADDPCIVLQRKQQETCLGCAALTVQAYLGARKFVCQRGKQKASTTIQEMRRCRAYTEQEAAGPAAKQQTRSPSTREPSPT